MKVGIDSYSYHRYFGEVYDTQEKPAKPMSYEDFLRRAVALKVDGVSMETCFLRSCDESYLKRLREIIDTGRLEVVVAWGHPEGFDGGTRPDAIADLRRYFPVCHALGAKVLRLTGSSLAHRNEPHGPQIDKLTRIFKECAVMADAEGVKLADENHFDFTTAEYLGLFQAVGHKSLGMCFNTGNCLRNGDDPVASARLLAPYILATHTKDVQAVYGRDPKDWTFFACTAVGRGIIDFPSLVAEMEKAG